MGKSNANIIVTRSRAKTLSLHTTTTPLTIHRRRKTTQSIPLDKVMEEQLKQLKLEKEKLERLKDDLKKQQEDLHSRSELAKQVSLLQKEKESQARVLNELRRGSSSQQVDTTTQLIGGLMNHFQCSQLEIKAPKFSDEENQNPLEFLADLENYFNVSNVSNVQKVWVFNNSLIGRAKVWLDLNKDVCDTYENFKKYFKSEFYSVQYQVKAKSKWAARRYKSQEGTLKSYFTKQSKEAKYFEPRLSTYEVNYAIIQQMPFRIRDVLATVDFADTQVLSQTLANLDSTHEEKESSNRYQNQSHKFSNNSGQIRNLSYQGGRNYKRQKFDNQQQQYHQVIPRANFNNQMASHNFILPNTQLPPPIASTSRHPGQRMSYNNQGQTYHHLN